MSGSSKREKGKLHGLVVCLAKSTTTLQRLLPAQPQQLPQHDNLPQWPPDHYHHYHLQPHPWGQYPRRAQDPPHVTQPVLPGKAQPFTQQTRNPCGCSVRCVLQPALCAHPRLPCAQVSIPVQTFPQYCMPGQYQLPFTFQLPMNLPGSFEYIGARNTCGSTTYNWTKAKIKYKLKAECVVPGIFTPNLRFKTYLTLQQRLAKMPTEIKSSSTQQVTKCCCSSQVSNGLHCKLQVARELMHSSVLNAVIKHCANTLIKCCDMVRVHAGTRHDDRSCSEGQLVSGVAGPG